MSEPTPADLAVEGAARLLLVVTIGAGILVGAIQTLRGDLEVQPAGLLLVVVVVATCFAVRSRERLPAHTGAAVLAFVLLSRLAYTLAADQPLISDFARMWDYALAAAAEGPLPPMRDPVQHTRALPVLTPLAWAGGGRPYAYQLANAAFVTGCVAITYALTRAAAGEAAATIAAILAAFAPEPLLASEIATHDIPGAFFALTALALVHRIATRPQPVWGLLASAGLLALAVGFAEVQRGTGLFLLGGSAAALLAFGPGRRVLGRARLRPLAIVVASFALASLGTDAVLDRLVTPESREANQRARWVWLASYANAESGGQLGALQQLEPLLAGLPTEDVRAFALSRTASDALDAPAERVPDYLRRLSVLFSLGDQYHFYLDDTRWGARWRATRIVPTREGAERVSGFFRSYTPLFRLLLLLAAGAALAQLCLGPAPPLALGLPLGFLAVSAAVLALLGEVQPRYLFPAWFVLPMLVGSAAVARRPERGDARRALRTLLAGTATGVVALLAVGVGLAVLRDRPAVGSTVALRGVARGDGAVAWLGRYEGALRPSPGRPASLALPALAGDALAFYVGPEPGAAPGCRTAVAVSIGGTALPPVELGADEGGRWIRVPLAGAARDVVVSAASAAGVDACPAVVAFPRLTGGSSAGGA